MLRSRLPAPPPRFLTTHRLNFFFLRLPADRSFFVLCCFVFLLEGETADAHGQGGREAAEWRLRRRRGHDRGPSPHGGELQKVRAYACAVDSVRFLRGCRCETVVPHSRLRNPLRVHTRGRQHGAMGILPINTMAIALASFFSPTPLEKRQAAS